MSKRKKRAWIGIIVAASVLLALVGGFYVYTLDYYRADDTAAAVFTSGTNIEDTGDTVVIRPSEAVDKGIGLIFYPGGKVAADAYVPLLEDLAGEGLTCVLVRMPMNLAVFNINGAEAVYDAFPEIGHWYLAGHSLGGAMASSYAGKHADRLDGLILLGAYPVNDADIPTIAIYGSEDIKLDRSKLEGVNTVEIAGGNHAYFGNYGEQEGDGTASISREEQQRQAVAAIMRFITPDGAGCAGALLG